MPVLHQTIDILFVGIGNKLIIVNLTNEEELASITLPPIKIPENLSRGQEDLLKETPNITSIATSKDNSLVVVSTHNKQVVIYNAEDLISLKTVRNFVINRAASKICFDNNNEVIVADKTGDAYLWKKENENEPVLLLGHLSMLLDVILSPCGKFIITCDRDEKIRVSHYPNSYNILCYCLGHEEFVTHVAIVNNQLLSASGDGTIRLWDYKNGKELYKMDANSLIKNELVEAFREEMDKNHVEVNAIPITEMQVHEHKTGFALIAITLFNLNSIELYEFNYEKQTISHLQKIGLSESSKILSYSLGNRLIVLTNGECIFYELCGIDVDAEKQFVLSSKQFNVFKQYQKIFDDCKLSIDKDVSVLYKRKFDNVQEYLERKKLRLEANIK